MNSSIKSTIAFLAGVATGAFLSWQYLKRKYSELAEEQLDAIADELEYERARVAQLEEKTYNNIVKDYGGATDYKDSEVNPVRGPYVITPEELGEVDEYDTTTLYYYADGVLVTLQDEVVEDVLDTVGLDFHTHFGEYEDDSVCIRNEKHKCDYEILKDSRNYADVKKPVRPRDTEE